MSGLRLVWREEGGENVSLKECKEADRRADSRKACRYRGLETPLSGFQTSVVGWVTQGCRDGPLVAWGSAVFWAGGRREQLRVLACL